MILRFVSVSTLILLAMLVIVFFARIIWVNSKIAARGAAASSDYVSANRALAPKSARTRIVLIGDSRIAQWPMQLWPENWEVINRGIGGETVAQLARRFSHDALALNPDVVLVESGINDLVAASFVDSKEQKKITHELQMTLRSFPGTANKTNLKIIIATIIPPSRPALLRLPFWKEEVGELVSEANAQLKMAHLYADVSVVDLASVVEITERGKTAEQFRADTLHLNHFGYQKLTAALIPVIKAALTSFPSIEPRP